MKTKINHKFPGTLVVGNWVVFLIKENFTLECNGSVLRLNMDNVSCSLIKRDFYEDQD